MPEPSDPAPDSFLTSLDAGITLPGSAGDNPVDNLGGAAPLVLFDGTCGFCANSVRVMQGGWFLACVRAVAFQRFDVSIHNLSVDKCAERLHVVDGERIYVGGAAIARILRAARGPWPLVGRILTWPGVSWIVGWAYDLVARHRHRLPGGSAACELPEQ